MIVNIPETTRCDDNDGYEAEYIFVEKDDWIKLGKILSSKPKEKWDISEENTSGGHGCIIEFNLYDLYKNSNIIEEEPKRSVIKFIEKITGNSWFLGFIAKKMDLSKKELFNQPFKDRVQWIIASKDRLRK
jgi:hypothetical protein